MKLLELAAKEIQTWPSGCDYVTQSPTTGVFVFNNDGSSDFEAVDIAQDAKTAAVTRSQWEAERARIAMGGTAASSKQEQESCPYEQELWDKVAQETVAALVSAYPCQAIDSEEGGRQINADALVADAMDIADAFMAERAQRMKQ